MTGPVLSGGRPGAWTITLGPHTATLEPRVFRVVGERGILAGLLFLQSLVFLFRAWVIVYPGRVWAEEGAIYLHNAYRMQPLQYLLTIELGYYSLINKLSALFAAKFVDLLWAPQVFLLFSFCAQILPSALVLYSRIPGLETLSKKAFALALLALVVPTHEVWLTTTTSQFHLCIAVALILVSDGRSRWGQLIRLLVLVFAGLTGGASLLLFPFFMWRSFATRKREKIQETVGFGAAVAIQMIVVSTAGSRGLVLDLQLVPLILFVKQIALPLLGVAATDQIAQQILDTGVGRIGWWSVLFLLPHLAILGALIHFRARSEAILFFLMSVLLASLSFLLSFEINDPGPYVPHLGALGAARYYYPANVLLWTAILMSPIAARPASLTRSLSRMVAMALVGVVLIVGVIDYEKSRLYGWFFSGPHWPTEVAKWKAGERALRIWPEPWWMVLPSYETRGSIRGIDRTERPPQ